MLDTDGFSGNYAKLPPPVMLRTEVVALITGQLLHVGRSPDG